MTLTSTLARGRCEQAVQACTIVALIALHDQVIAPTIAESRSPVAAATPHWTRVDRDYETLRVGMQTLFYNLGITTQPAAA